MCSECRQVTCGSFFFPKSIHTLVCSLGTWREHRHLVRCRMRHLLVLIGLALCSNLWGTLGWKLRSTGLLKIWDPFPKSWIHWEHWHLEKFFVSNQKDVVLILGGVPRLQHFACQSNVGPACFLFRGASSQLGEPTVRRIQPDIPYIENTYLGSGSWQQNSWHLGLRLQGLGEGLWEA